MKIFYLIAYFSIVMGCFLLLNTTPLEFYENIRDFFIKHLPKRKQSMKKQIQMSLKQKKLRGIRRILAESRSVLQLTHRTDKLPLYIVVSIVMSLTGILISILFENYYLMPVLAIGLALVPWVYIIYSATKYRNELNEELETALSMITSSYLRTDNIISAIRENVDHLNYPVKEVFQKFLVQADLISSDIVLLLQELENSIDSSIFQDWVDQVILCQENRTLKNTLQSIVNKLSETREVNGDLEILMYEPLKEFMTMSVVILLEIPFIRMINVEWYNCLMLTMTGQIIVAGTAMTFFISLFGVMQKTKPVEYRR